MICSREHSAKSASTHGTTVFIGQSMRSNSMKRQTFNTAPPPPPPIALADNTNPA